MPERLCGSDLDMVHEPLVPERLEHGIGETEHQDVLDRFLGKVMVDAKDLALPEMGMHRPVELPGGVEVAAEGLLDHQVAAAPVLAVQARGTEIPDHGLEHDRRDGEIEDAIAPGLVTLFERGQGVPQSCRVGSGIAVIEWRVIKTAGEPVPQGFVEAAAKGGLYRIVHHVAEFVRREADAAGAEDKEPVGKHPVLEEPVERWKELPFRQVP